MKRVFGRKQTVTTAKTLRHMEATLQASRKKLVSRTKVITQQSLLKKCQDYFFAIAQMHVHARTYTHQGTFRDKRSLFCSLQRQLHS
jgi:hypothetical protein